MMVSYPKIDASSVKKRHETLESEMKKVLADGKAEIFFLG
jgi:hypothetical protein